MHTSFMDSLSEVSIFAFRKCNQITQMVEAFASSSDPAACSSETNETNENWLTHTESTNACETFEIQFDQIKIAVEPKRCHFYFC